MAYAFVASVSAGSSDAVSVTTGTVDTTGANLLVVVVATDSASSNATISDSKGNTWTAATFYDDATSTRVRISYCFGGTVGTGHTFTATHASAPRPSIAMLAFSGAVTAPFGNENGAGSPGVTSKQPGSITPPENNCLVVSGLSFNATNSPTQDAGMTEQESVAWVSNQCRGLRAAYKIQTTAAAINPTWSWSTSCDCATDIASFKAAAAGGTNAGVKRLIGGSRLLSGLTA